MHKLHPVSSSIIIFSDEKLKSFSRARARMNCAHAYDIHIFFFTRGRVTRKNDVCVYVCMRAREDAVCERSLHIVDRKAYRSIE